MGVLVLKVYPQIFDMLGMKVFKRAVMNQVYSKKPPSPYAALQKSRWKTYGKVTHQLHQLSLIPSIWNRLHERKKKKIEIYGIKHMEHPSPHIST